MKYLFIAEKPSVMREVKQCYDNHRAEVQEKLGTIDFIALSGHVCTYFQPDDYAEWAQVPWSDVDYPMVPYHWGIKQIDDQGKIDVMNRIAQIAPSYDAIIVGTDSDVEGYGIYYLLEMKLGLTKMKALRFVERSLTDAEILESLFSMTDYHTDPVHLRSTMSFLLRAHTDWLFGMNCTRLMSLRQDHLMTIGRVKAPTIRLVYDNSMAIEEFKMHKYFTLEADYGDFQAIYVDEHLKPVHFQDAAVMDEPEAEGTVTHKKTEHILTHAPQLYDLTALQSDAGSMFGYTPSEVLAAAQALYEKHKLISYPRTACRYVSVEKSHEFPGMLSLMTAFPDLAPFVSTLTQDDIDRVLHDSQVVNDSEVEKEAHDALLPTSIRPDLSALTEMERNVCELIYKRLLAQFLPQLEEDKTKALIQHGDMIFMTKGKAVINQGWRSLYKEMHSNILPPFEEGDTLTALSFHKTERKTKPPRRLTQTTLVAAMKNIANLISDKELKKALADSKGIGTVATRHSIITDIIKRGYVADRKDGLHITEAGKVYIKSLEGIEIASPIFAASLDNNIKKIQRGEIDFSTAYKDMLRQLQKVCMDIQTASKYEKQTVIRCPKCGEFLTLDRHYSCPNCRQQFPKTIAGVPITEDILERLTAGEIVGPFDFQKKDHTIFSARLVMQEYYKKNSTDTEFRIDFNFSSGILCPCCGTDYVTINKNGAFCDCGLKLFRNMMQHTFNDEELQMLLQGEIVPSVLLTKKNGEQFTTNLQLNMDKKSLEFVFN